jgi:hypothetical protein
METTSSSAGEFGIFEHPKNEILYKRIFWTFLQFVTLVLDCQARIQSFIHVNSPTPKWNNLKIMLEEIKNRRITAFNHSLSLTYNVQLIAKNFARASYVANILLCVAQIFLPQYLSRWCSFPDS